MSKQEWLHAGTLGELEREGPKVVRGGIAVFYHEGRVSAVDNRCPHLGFPLHLGTVCDGILTCHWHHARFDVCSGGTLDPWADDVPAYDVKTEGEDVWVSAAPRARDSVDSLKRRLREGLEHNIGIVIAKAVAGLCEAGVPADDMFRLGVEFGVSRGNGWGAGLTILTAMRSVLPELDEAGRMLALYHGFLHVARAGSGRPPRHLLGPLPAGGADGERLAQWYRNCAEVRDTQGAEKVLLTAVRRDVPPDALAETMLAAATDHFYLDGGHTFDFHNKAFEALAYMPPESAGSVLASLVPLLGDPTRSEELHHWQSPIDLVNPLREAFRHLPGKGEGVSSDGDGLLPDEGDAVEQLLGDRPLETIDKLTGWLRTGVAPARIAQWIAVAAAERIARFHTQNDFRDWVAVLHTFTHAHAVHCRLQRSSEPLLWRGLYYGAMAVYHDRFLNVPRAPKPKAHGSGAAEAAAAAGAGESGVLRGLLDLMDRRQQVDESASWVAGYLRANGDPAALIRTLGHALLREDADFHTFQLFEAAVREHGALRERSDAFAERAKETMLVACARYLAAHAPTARETPHTAHIALRLSRGEKLFESSDGGV